MKVAQLLKNLAARAGYHVVVSRHNPAHTLTGLPHYQFGAVIDVGANSKQFAKAMRPRSPAAEFHCFEPMPKAFELLSTWPASEQRVTALNLALGEVQGSLEMNVHVNYDTPSSLLATTADLAIAYPEPIAQSKLTVKVQPLNDVVERLIPPISGDILLKIDVQRYEAQVLRGASKMLGKVRTCILKVSVDELYVGQGSFTELVSILGAAGLQYSGNFDQICGIDGYVISLDAVIGRRSTPLKMTATEGGAGQQL